MHKLLSSTDVVALAKHTPPLPEAFHLRPALVVAKQLIGKYVLAGSPRSPILVRLTEVEAYKGEVDPASHAHRGQTSRNWPMFEIGGTCYVYLSYGVHYCVNVAVGPVGVGHAVLLRSAEPVIGIAAMQRNRNLQPNEESPALTCGPGRLAQALGIGLDHNGRKFDEPFFKIIDLPIMPRASVAASVRIGISKAADLPWRFYAKRSLWLSGPKRLNNG